MPEIQMRGGFVVLFDEEDAPDVLGAKWHAYRQCETAYACRNVYLPDGKRTKRFMHNLLTGWSFVDHVNGNGLDNRRANLREATSSLNQANRVKVRGASRFKGVRKRGTRWEAGIKVRGRRHHLGGFIDQADAARVYDSAARGAFGEFAALNFPAVGERSALTGQIRET